MEHAYGFWFTTPDKTIVTSGDTAPCKNIISYSKNADILILEDILEKIRELYSGKVVIGKDLEIL